MQAKPVAYLALRPTGAAWEFTARGVESKLSEAGVGARSNEPSAAVAFVGRALGRMRLIRNIGLRGSKAYVVVMMGPTERRLFPVSYTNEVIPYCFDCWPKDYARWHGIFRRNRVQLAFFTARQSANYFRRRMPSMDCIWLPEATLPELHSSERPLRDRSIDVLELGRRHEGFHQAIESRLAEAGARHLYETEVGRIIFASDEDLKDALGDSKVSICFPSSVTHPERSGDVETVTHRYFESLASKTLVVGRGPAELNDLFGYNPVVEIDENDPADQLMSILERIDSYQGFVEQNRSSVIRVGSWGGRVGTLLDELAERGYAVDAAT